VSAPIAGHWPKGGFVALATSDAVRLAGAAEQPRYEKGEDAPKVRGEKGDRAEERSSRQRGPMRGIRVRGIRVCRVGPRRRLGPDHEAARR